MLALSQRLWLLVPLSGIALLALLVLINYLASDSSTSLRNQAEAAAQIGDWNTALRYWKKINATMLHEVLLT